MKELQVDAPKAVKARRPNCDVITVTPIRIQGQFFQPNIVVLDRHCAMATKRQRFPNLSRGVLEFFPILVSLHVQRFACWRRRAAAFLC